MVSLFSRSQTHLLNFYISLIVTIKMIQLNPNSHKWQDICKKTRISLIVANNNENYKVKVFMLVTNGRYFYHYIRNSRPVATIFILGGGQNPAPGSKIDLFASNVV